MKEEVVVRILVVDDSEAVRRALRNVLESHRDWRICGEAGSGKEALEQVEATDPDIILLDFRMPDMNGLEVAREVRHYRYVPILLITLYMSEQLKDEARRAGIRGACPKEQAGSVLNGIEALLRHDTYFPANQKAA